MKLKQIGFFLSLLIFVQCSSRNGYLIQGHIEGLPDGEIALIKAFNGDTLNLGKAKNGYFTFKKEGDFEGDAVRLNVHKGYIPLTLFIEPGVITVSGHIKKPEEIKATGTPSNDAWNIYIAEENLIHEKMRANHRLQVEAQKDSIRLKKLKEEYSALLQEYNQYRKVFARKYNHTIISPMFLSAGIGDLDYEQTVELVKTFSPKMPNNWYLNRLKKRCEILKKCARGEIAPDFSLPTPEGKTLSLSDLRGQVVLVDFWASWCKGCRVENKNIIPLYKKYNAQGFTVISVSLDKDAQKWIQAIKEDNLPWNNHVSSLKGWECPVTKQLGVAHGMTGIPYSLLLDKDGRVIGHNLRGKTLALKLKELFE